MGSNFCSTASTTKTDFQSGYFELIYGQDQKQGKIQHDENIKTNQNNNLNIQTVLNECTQKLKILNLMYKDPTMPTDKLILKSISKKQQNGKKQIQALFLRPYRFLYNVDKGKPYKIIKVDDSSPNYIIVKDQVMQYFAVFLCFLASNPKIIEDIILTQPNSFGLHAIKMNINGTQAPIYIDDYILCSNSQPVFMQPVKNMYLWPNLLQKAWFKTHGFAQKIIGKSSPDEVFQAFLNYPYKKFVLEELKQELKKDLLKNHLYKLDNQHGCILTTKKDPQTHIGLSGRKYLYLLGSFEYENKRLYYIRNPCGNFSFRGMYDQISEDLRNFIKKKFNSVTIPEGNFILDQSQFLQQISIFSIFYYLKTFKTTKFSMNLQRNHQIFIQTELKAQGCLSLCFRQQSNKKNQTSFSPITYQIFDMKTGEIVSDQQNNQGCFGMRNSYFFNDLIKKLPQSKYLIRIKKKDRKKSYTGIESALIANFVQQLKFDIKNQQQFTQLFKEYLMKEGKKNLSIQNKKSGVNPIQHSAFRLGDLICIYIQYVSQKQQQFKIQISFPQLKNLQLIYPEINLKEVSVLPHTLSPSHKQEIIVFEKIDLTGETELGIFELQAF